MLIACYCVAFSGGGGTTLCLPNAGIEKEKRSLVVWSLCTRMLAFTFSTRARQHDTFGGMAEWLLEKELQRLVLVIVGTDSGDTLERWTFNVHKEEERPVLKDGRWAPPVQIRTRSCRISYTDTINTASGISPAGRS